MKFRYPSARRDETVAEDLHGTTVGLFVSQIKFGKTRKLSLDDSLVSIDLGLELDVDLF